MPCRTDWPSEPYWYPERRNTAQLLIYARREIGQTPIPKTLLEAAEKGDRDYVPQLCKLIRNLNEDALERIVYDGRNPQARKLADWWEEHEELDRQRMEEEELEALNKQLVRTAVRKLEPEERRAINEIYNIEIGYFR